MGRGLRWHRRLALLVCFRDIDHASAAVADRNYGLLHPLIAGFTFCSRFTTAPSWNCHFSGIVSSAAGDSRARQGWGNRKRRQEQPLGRADDIVQSLCDEGQLDKALEFMHDNGNVWCVNLYSSLLQACSRRKALAQTHRVHALLVKHGLESNIFLGECMVSTLVKCGGLEDAVQLFQRLASRTAFAWTALISGYTAAGLGEEALRLYDSMRDEGVKPNKYTIVSSLRACAALADLGKGKLIHAEALKYGWQSDLFVGTCLVDMYAKCGSIVDAQDVFDRLSQRDVVSWTAILVAYVQYGQAETALKAYQTMREQGVSADVRTFVSTIRACAMLAETEEDCTMDGQAVKAQTLTKGKVLHADARRLGHDGDLFIGSTLISMYGKCGRVKDAENVFRGLSQRNVVSWNAMLVAYTQLDQAKKVLQLYRQMHKEDVSPDVRTFVSMLQACAMLAETEDNVILCGHPTRAKYLERGKAIHAYAWRKGCRSDIFISSVLVSMYGKCGSIKDARTVFDEVFERDAVSWNAMLSAYLEQGKGEKVLHLYGKMLKTRVSPDDRTFVSLLQACSMLAEKEKDVAVDGQSTKVEALEKGKALHSEAWRKGYNSDVFIGSALISMYAKVGSIADAQHVFDGLSKWNVASWTAMVGAFVEHGQSEKALRLYQQMQKTGVNPSEITLVCILRACSITGSLNVCRQIHHSVVSRGINVTPLLSSTLIHAYGRCASMIDAQAVFDALLQPVLVSWTALIAGYARQGNCVASLQFYEKMRLAGIKPDGVTFLSILSACSHAGLVDIGVQFFESMTRDYGINPEVEHYASMVDLLGRAGYFSSVECLLSTMPMQPDLTVWLCLLGACRKHGKVELGKRAFDCAILLQSDHAAAYLLMWNIYAQAGMPDFAKKVDESGNTGSVCKMTGQSWVEHGKEVYNFVVGDREHPQHQQVYDLLGKVIIELEGRQHSQPRTTGEK